MKTRTVHNIATGVIEEIPVDNAWILARQSPTVLLSASALSVAVNGSITLSAQLRTPELADYTYDNLTDNRSIQLQLGDSVQVVNLINGFFSDTLPFILEGTYKLECLDLPSNSIEVVVS